MMAQDLGIYYHSRRKMEGPLGISMNIIAQRSLHFRPEGYTWERVCSTHIPGALFICRRRVGVLCLQVRLVLYCLWYTVYSFEL